MAFVVLCPASYSRSTFHTLHACPWRGQRALLYAGSSFLGNRFLRRVPAQRSTNFFSPRAMFSGGGILGVGPSEIIVIVAVGWLVLGPKKLFELAKDSGRVLGELRRTAAEAKDTFTEAMEMDMLAEEAQRLGEPSIEKKDTAADVGETTEPGPENLEKQVVNEVDNRIPNANPAVNSAFLDQLKRASDPNQVSPVEVPDFAIETDQTQQPTMNIPDLVSQEEEEEAFERLEREYFAAKQRMERKKGETASKANGSGDNLSGKA